MLSRKEVYVLLWMHNETGSNGEVNAMAQQHDQINAEDAIRNNLMLKQSTPPNNIHANAYVCTENTTNAKSDSGKILKK